MAGGHGAGRHSPGQLHGCRQPQAEKEPAAPAGGLWAGCAASRYPTGGPFLSDVCAEVLTVWYASSLPQRTEEKVQHHGHPPAGDCETERGGHHQPGTEADPGVGSGLLPELGGGCRHLPEFLRLNEEGPRGRASCPSYSTSPRGERSPRAFLSPCCILFQSRNTKLCQKVNIIQEKMPPRFDPIVYL